MLSLLNSVDGVLKTFLNQLYESLGVVGFLGIILGVEAFFVILFSIKSAFSYEARLKRSLNKINRWLFTNKTINEQNIVEFNALVKKGPKRLVYYWQQFILYREGGPSKYLTEENVIEKPLKTSSWKSNVKNLMMFSVVWSVVGLIFGFASQPTQAFTAQIIAYALIFPLLVLTLGSIAVLFIKAKRVANLDDIYHMYHLFARFLNNACAELTPYVDFDLLFTAKEIENGNAQLREYYEQRARKAKEEFDKAKHSEVKDSDFNFDNVGVEGALLLDRAMKESEVYISAKTTTLSQIAQVESQKEALRRNYENVQMDLQRKIQTSKENIQKLIEQQAATTSRIEVGLLKQQQDKEISKQAGLQKDYDQEEARYKASKAELDADIEKLNVVLKESLDVATKGMASEYKSFFEKVMKSAYKVAERQVIDEKNTLIEERDKNESELINVQTQIKRLMDENSTLRDRLEKVDNNYQETTQTPEGHYDENGNFIYADGSYHDADGMFHDVDGKVYDMNGALVYQDADEEALKAQEAQQLVDDTVNQFGEFIPEEELAKPIEEEPKVETDVQVGPVVEEYVPIDTDANNLEALIEQTIADDKKEEQPVVEESVEPVVEESEEIKEESEPAEEVEEAVETVEEENKEEATEEEPAEKKRGRGRPKKVIDETEVVEKPHRGRGRPKKVVEETEEVEKPHRGRGRPKKVVDETEVVEKPHRGRGRPKKVEEKAEDGDSLDKINQLINEEEQKLNDMNEMINSQIDNALSEEGQAEIDKEKDEIMKSIESLQAQAEDARNNGESEEELAKINQRIEDLIKSLSSLSEN